MVPDVVDFMFPPARAVFGQGMFAIDWQARTHTHTLCVDNFYKLGLGGLCIGPAMLAQEWTPAQLKRISLAGEEPT